MSRESWDIIIQSAPYIVSVLSAAYTERVRRALREELDRELRLYAKREDLIRIETLTQQVREDIIEIKQMLRDTLSGRG